MMALRATTTLFLTLAIQATRHKTTGAGVTNATVSALVAWVLEIAQLVEAMTSNRATATMLVRKPLQALRKAGDGARTA